VKESCPSCVKYWQIKDNSLCLEHTHTHPEPSSVWIWGHYIRS